MRLHWGMWPLKKEGGESRLSSFCVRRKFHGSGPGVGFDRCQSVRPAGAAWSSVRDMLKYVSMELAEGKLPDGKTYISKEPLLERRVPRLPSAKTKPTAWD